MTQRALTRATYADVLAAPEHLVAEIVDGELSLSPRPSPRHADAASVLGMDLGTPFHRGRGGPGGWWIFTLDGQTFRLSATYANDDLVRIAPFEAIELEFSA